jgi:hypothetical protein
MTVRKLLVIAVSLAAAQLAIGCSSKPKPAQISGKVTFKGQPVPAGWISFTPEVASGGNGPVKVYQIKDGVYDSSKENQPGLYPGTYLIKIAGFDGKKIPFYGQGKQIFNPVDDKYTVPPDTSTKDFVIPESAGQNVKIQPTADS